MTPKELSRKITISLHAGNCLDGYLSSSLKILPENIFKIPILVPHVASAYCLETSIFDIFWHTALLLRYYE